MEPGEKQTDVIPFFVMGLLGITGATLWVYDRPEVLAFVVVLIVFLVPILELRRQGFFSDPDGTLESPE